MKNKTVKKTMMKLRTQPIKYERKYKKKNSRQLEFFLK